MLDDRPFLWSSSTLPVDYFSHSTCPACVGDRGRLVDAPRGSKGRGTNVSANGNVDETLGGNCEPLSFCAVALVDLDDFRTMTRDRDRANASLFRFFAGFFCAKEFDAVF